MFTYTLIVSLFIILRLQKTVIGPYCYQFKKNETMREEELTRAVIYKYFKRLIENDQEDIKDNERETVVILTTKDEVSKKIFDYLEDSFKDRRNWSIVFYPSNQQTEYKDKVQKFLKKSHGILVANYNTFLGVQARNVVLFIGEQTDQQIARSMILRSMAFAIVIHDLKERNFDIPGIAQDEDLYSWRDGKPSNKEFLLKRLETALIKEKSVSKYELQMERKGI